MAEKKYTSVYVSIPVEDDDWIDQLRIKKIKQDKKQYSKNDIVKDLLYKGMDVENGKYLELEPEMDEFISKLGEITIEKDGEKLTYKKSKKQVYYMIIEKGLESFNE